jgi:hypothetical protein
MMTVRVSASQAAAAGLAAVHERRRRAHTFVGWCN